MTTWGSDPDQVSAMKALVRSVLYSPNPAPCGSLHIWVGEVQCRHTQACKPLSSCPGMAGSCGQFTQFCRLLQFSFLGHGVICASPSYAGSSLGHTTGTVLSAGGTSDTSSLQEVFPDSRAARGRVGDESSSGIFCLLMRSTI